jgi:hypothetical protein
MKVKKLLLIGAMALMIAPTHAAMVGGAAGSCENCQLSDKILGSWCGSWGYNFPNAPENIGHLWWAKSADDCANRGGIRFDMNGYEYYRFGPQGWCQYTKIKFMANMTPLHESDIRPLGPDGKFDRSMVRPGKPSGVYLIEGDCKDGDDHWTESFYVQTVRGWMIREESKETH